MTVQAPFFGGLGAARRALLGVGLGRVWAGRVNGQGKGCRPSGQHPLGWEFKQAKAQAHSVSHRFRSDTESDGFFLTVKVECVNRERNTNAGGKIAKRNRLRHERHKREQRHHRRHCNANSCKHDTFNAWMTLSMKRERYANFIDT